MGKPSIYGKNPDPNEGLDTFSVDRLQPEIAHLKKRRSTRTLQQDLNLGARLSGFLFLGVLLTLIFMDPFYYAYEKDKAVRAFLYLHAYDNAARTAALERSGIFTEGDLLYLTRRSGDFHDLFKSADAAAAAAAEVVGFMQALYDMKVGNYEKLSWINKIRYVLFTRNGIPLPTQWSILNPVIKPDTEDEPSSGTPEPTPAPEPAS